MAIRKAYKDVDFKGHIRPDHERMICSEKGMPGYELYDRALALTYINVYMKLFVKQKSKEFKSLHI